ncbi:hypothetical protein B0T20DRAFT_426475 [Sordaria brevicollis]|uniref:Uncharacterized protein n=1 Tax=Sordaria brevicollis TaxID=83679 RepID=A0AAE0U2N1_SORBR|nr:hypothetical protein B0T20DRAFT_426475 [Sordaria brevicollis]
MSQPPDSLLHLLLTLQLAYRVLCTVSWLTPAGDGCFDELKQATNALFFDRYDQWKKSDSIDFNDALVEELTSLTKACLSCAWASISKLYYLDKKDREEEAPVEMNLQTFEQLPNVLLQLLLCEGEECTPKSKYQWSRVCDWMTTADTSLGRIFRNFEPNTEEQALLLHHKKDKWKLIPVIKSGKPREETNLLQLPSSSTVDKTLEQTSKAGQDVITWLQSDQPMSYDPYRTRGRVRCLRRDYSGGRSPLITDILTKIGKSPDLLQDQSQSSQCRPVVINHFFRGDGQNLDNLPLSYDKMLERAFVDMNRDLIFQLFQMYPAEVGAGFVRASLVECAPNEHLGSRSKLLHSIFVHSLPDIIYQDHHKVPLQDHPQDYPIYVFLDNPTEGKELHKTVLHWMQYETVKVCIACASMVELEFAQAGDRNNATGVEKHRDMPTGTPWGKTKLTRNMRNWFEGARH